MRPRKLRHMERRRDSVEDYRIQYTLPSLDLRDIDKSRDYFDFEAIFNNDNPVYFEIGCGKGKFASELARRNPNINIIGIDCVPDVLVQACEKAKADALTNLRFLEMKAEYLPVFVPENSVSGIYLNFSTPYPKKSHIKHRLTAPAFLKIYSSILKKGGYIYQKTDSPVLFEYSLETLSQNGFELHNVTLDLHKSDFEDNIMTEYETRFAEQGLPIYRLEAKLK